MNQWEFFFDIGQYKPSDKIIYIFFFTRKKLFLLIVPTGRKLQLTLRHFSEAPANSCELLKQQQRAIKVYLLEELR